jgi:hypothetical protein
LTVAAAAINALCFRVPFATVTEYVPLV